MALEKQVIIDKVEVIGDTHVQVRTATRVLEDGEVLSSSYHRHVVTQGDDYSNEDPKVQAICSALWS